MMNSNNDVILKIELLKQYFSLGRNKVVKAVDGVSFDIYKGEIFSLVGESGSGKSTLGRSIIRLYNPEGEIYFKDSEVSGNLSEEAKNKLRLDMQMIFQDPMASLNPRLKVRDIIGQGLDVNKLYQTTEERDNKIRDMIKKVGLLEDHLDRYPHQFSGGQRQRIGIARAMIMQPDFIIADEAVSALDVSIQAQVINLLKQFQKEFGMTYLFIAHDLSMVKHISDRIGVMHKGHLVELGNKDDIYNHPVHPYTKSLLSAIPHPNPRYEKVRKRIQLDESRLDYTKGELRQLTDTHYLLATEAELEEWSKTE